MEYRYRPQYFKNIGIGLKKLYRSSSNANYDFRTLVTGISGEIDASLL